MNAKIVIVGIIILFLVGCFSLFTVFGYFQYEFRTPIRSSDEYINFRIEKGSSINDISSMLFSKKLISHPFILKAYLGLHKDKVIQAGNYRILTKDLNLISLVEYLQNGSFEKRLTFIEGWRLEEYRDYLKNEIGEEFANEFYASSFSKEGYMFPDTYVIDEDYLPENLASWMRNNFSQKFSVELQNKAKSRGLSVEDVVILSSIVEREMNKKSDRPIVAGILVNRLKFGWPLQADATVQYAKGNSLDWWPKIGRSDYRSVNSSYNTYLNKGFPPSPISNPSLDAIKAVIDYADTPYLFYISGSDGKTYYAKTIEEHNENVARYIK